jgi:hypothetical protein
MTSLAATAPLHPASPWIGITFAPHVAPDVARARLLGFAQRLPIAAAGGVPVTLIAGSAFGLDLKVLALVVLMPVIAGLIARMAVHPATRRLVLQAVAAGIVATALYDLCRGSFLWLGLMHHDPIPHIGAALGIEPNWAAGYTWRYLGNGSGLALAFLALGLRGTRVGVVYGLGVCSCLLLTLLVSPYGTEILFPLNVTTVVMATLGHAIYGAVLGTIAARLHDRRADAPAERQTVGTLTISAHRRLVVTV